MKDGSRPWVFISYAHKDEVWKDRLVSYLGLLEKAGHVDVWDDRRINPGATWFDEIKGAIGRATIAVCLVSPNFLASDFIRKEEIPYLVERREAEGMVLIPTAEPSACSAGRSTAKVPMSG